MKRGTDHDSDKDLSVAQDLLATGACALVGAVSLPDKRAPMHREGKNLTNAELIPEVVRSLGEKRLEPSG